MDNDDFKEDTLTGNVMIKHHVNYFKTGNIFHTPTIHFTLIVLKFTVIFSLFKPIFRFHCSLITGGGTSHRTNVMFIQPTSSSAMSSSTSAEPLVIPDAKTNNEMVEIKTLRLF